VTEPFVPEDRPEAARTAQPSSGCVIAAVAAAVLFGLIVIIAFGLGAMWFWWPSGVPAPGVTILAEAPGLAPEDVERQVVWPIESQVSGAAGVQQVRSASRFGSCRVSVDFEPKTNIFEARQRLVERLQRAMTELPPNVTPVLAPISVSEREVLLIGLQSIAEPKTTEDRTTNGMDLRTLAEHVLRNRLLTVPGVSQVVVTGGIRKQCQVELDPARLLTFGVTSPQVEEALKRNNTVGTGGLLRRGDLELPVSVLANSPSLQDLEAIVVLAREGVPVRIKDVASVRFGGADRLGDGAIWTKDGSGAHDGPAVILTVLNELNTSKAEIDPLLTELQHLLPPDVKLERQTFTQEDISVSLQLPPGSSRKALDLVCRKVEAALTEISEIRSVWRRGGPGETADCVDGADGPVMFVALERKSERRRELILADIRARIAEFPGVCARLGQPASQRLDCVGVDAQIAVKVFGPDLLELQETARQIQAHMSEVPGVVDLLVEPQGERQRVNVRIRREEAARYGVAVAAVSAALETVFRGRKVGEVLEGDRRLDLMLVYDEKLRSDPGAIANLLLETPTGSGIRLGQLADVVRTTGPVALYRENMMRRIVVSCNVQGRDRTAVLTEIRQVLRSAEKNLKPAYHIEYAGCALAPGS